MKKLICLLFGFALLLVACVDNNESLGSASLNQDASSEAEISDVSESEISDVSESEISDVSESDGFALDADEIEFIHIASMPESVDLKCYSYSAIKNMAAYFNNMTLEEEFPENPDEYNGMSYILQFKCKDGTTREIIHFGNKFVKESGGDWKKMSIDDASLLETMVKYIDVAPEGLDAVELIDMARLFAANEYPIIYDVEAEDDFKADIATLEDGRIKVDFELYIFGYDTDEIYTVMLDPQGAVMDITDRHEGEYSCYLPYVSEESVKSAEEKLASEEEKYGSGGGYYLQIDSEGYLCLANEIIVDIEPPEPDENGELEAGCGFDHEHKFFSERISSEAFGE